jgi:O-antigen/teichoic acid export membrane protein
MRWLLRFRSKIMSNRVHLINGGSLIISKIAVYILYFLAIPLFIKIHGQGAYGLVAFFSIMIGYTVLLENGLSYAVTWRYTRALAQGMTHPEKIIRASVPLYALLSAVSILLLIMFAETISILVWNKSDYILPIRLLGLGVGVLILDALPVSVLQSQNKLAILNLNRFIGDGIRVSALFFAIFVENPLLTVVIFLLFSALVRLILDCVACFRESLSWEIFRPIFSINEIISNIRIAPTMFGIAALSLVISLYDKIFIAEMLSESDFAYYAFASDLCTKAYIIFFAFSSAAYNTLIRRHATAGSLRGMMYAYAAALFVMGFGYYLPLSLYGHIVVSDFLGHDFSNHTMPLVKVLSVSSMLYLAFTVFEANLNAQGNIFSVLIAYAAGLTLLFAVAPCMVASYSVMGMGFALVLMFGLMFLIVFLSYLISFRSIRIRRNGDSINFVN